MEFGARSSENPSASFSVYGATTSKIIIPKEKVNAGRSEDKKIFPLHSKQAYYLKKISHQNKLVKNIDGFVQHEDKKSAVKRNCKDREKKSLQVSARKSKLADGQAKIGSLSTSPTVSRNLLYPERDCKIFNKKTENNFGRILTKEASGMKNCNSKGKTRDIMEIEVFMPFVDVERNEIIYPQFINPTVKRYLANETVDLKSKGYVHKNVHLNEINKENATKTHLYLKKRKDLQVNFHKNNSKLEKKKNPSNLAENTLVKRKSPSRNLKHLNRDDKEQGRTVSEIQNSSANQTKNRLSSHTAGECANVSHTELERTSKKTSSVKSWKETDKNHGSVKIFSNIHELVYNGVVESPIEAAYKSIGKKYTSLSRSNNKEFKELNADITDDDDDDDIIESDEEVTSKKVTKPLSPSFKDVKRKETKTSKSSSLIELTSETEESISSINKTTNGSNESGWRSAFPMNSSRGHQGTNKWRRKVEDDSINLKRWIERSKYLQNRDKQRASEKRKQEKIHWRRTN